MASGFLARLRDRLFTRSPRVAVLRLDGVIGPGGSKLRGAKLNIEAVAQVIEKAFSVKRVAAVAVVVNSPGGSPVQAALIAGRIRALAREKEVPVLAFAEDVAASGGYWLACAGDEIFVDPASIVGSIGVIYAGFGFQGLISRHGVERRVHTAGEHKGALDPFLPEDPDEVARLKALQEDIHEQFKAMVRARRAGKLTGEEAELFSGAFWTGERAVALGLADGLGDVRTIVRTRYGEKVRMIPVSVKRSFLKSLAGGTRVGAATAAAGTDHEALGHALAEGAVAAVEDRLAWSRYGL